MSSEYNSENLKNPSNPGRDAIGYCRAVAGFYEVSESTKSGAWRHRILSSCNRIQLSFRDSNPGRGAIGYCNAAAGVSE